MQLKHLFCVVKIIKFSGNIRIPEIFPSILLFFMIPAGNYMVKVKTFKVNAIGVVLVSLLLTSNITHIFVLVFLLLTLSK